MSNPSVAFLLFHVAQERNYIHDDLVPAVSAELAALGVENQIYETVVPAIDAAGAQDFAAVDALAEKLRAGGHTTCVYTRLWSAGVFARLRERVPGVTWVYFGDPR